MTQQRLERQQANLVKQQGILARFQAKLDAIDLGAQEEAARQGHIDSSKPKGPIKAAPSDWSGPAPGSPDVFSVEQIRGLLEQGL